MRIREIFSFLIIFVIIIFSGCLSGPEDQSAKQNATEQASIEKPSDSLSTHGTVAPDTTKETSKKDIQGLLLDLNDSDRRIRLDAAKALGDMLAGKGSKMDQDMERAIYGVIKKDPLLDAVVSSLEYTLKDVDQDVKIEATRSLGKIGDKHSINPLIEALSDSDPHIRANAAEALGIIGIPAKSEYALRKALEKESDPEVKRSIAAALKAMKLEPYPAPMTGTYIIGEEGTGQGELTIKNDLEKDALAILTYQSERPAIGVFIRAHDTCNINGIRDDVYNLYFTTGDIWDNSQKKFTENASGFKFEDPLNFIAQSGYWEYKVTLHAVYGGNARVIPVDLSNFPNE